MINPQDYQTESGGNKTSGFGGIVKSRSLSPKSETNDSFLPISSNAEKSAYEARLRAAQVEIFCLKRNHELEITCLRAKNSNW